MVQGAARDVVGTIVLVHCIDVIQTVAGSVDSLENVNVDWYHDMSE